MLLAPIGFQQHQCYYTAVLNAECILNAEHILGTGGGQHKGCHRPTLFDYQP